MIAARHHREIDPEDNRIMLDLWRQDFNTNEIAHRLGLKEFQVANQLPIVRLASRGRIA